MWCKGNYSLYTLFKLFKVRLSAVLHGIILLILFNSVHFNPQREIMLLQ